MAGSSEHFSSAGYPAPRRDLEWQDDALCAQTAPELFVVGKGESTNDAKRICAQCDVGLQCLLHALANDERVGVYGGMSARERKKLTAAAREEVERAFIANQAKIKRL